MWQTGSSSMSALPAHPPTIRMLVADAERILASGPHPEKAHRDSEELLLFALRRDVPSATRAWLIAREKSAVTPDVALAFDSLMKRRVAGEPTQYITGESEFYGLPFNVTRAVLIPRPETEHLVEKAILMAQRISQPRIVDVGTGSGAIAIALACKLPDAQIAATEVSPDALAIARGNAERNGMADRIRFLEGDLLRPVAGELFDFVVSNPPYVPERDRASLAVEVRDYEPAQALFAGEDGLAVYRRLIPAALAALAPGGYLVLEIGYGQSEAVRDLLLRAGFAGIEFTADLQGIPRVALAHKP